MSRAGGYDFLSFLQCGRRALLQCGGPTLAPSVSRGPCPVFSFWQLLQLPSCVLHVSLVFCLSLNVPVHLLGFGDTHSKTSCLEVWGHNFGNRCAGRRDELIQNGKKRYKIYGIIIQRRLYGSYVEIFSIN